METLPKLLQHKDLDKNGNASLCDRKAFVESDHPCRLLETELHDSTPCSVSPQNQSRYGEGEKGDNFSETDLVRQLSPSGEPSANLTNLQAYIHEISSKERNVSRPKRTTSLTNHATLEPKGKEIPLGQEEPVDVILDKLPVNGSNEDKSSFKQFYEAGGRNYETFLKLKQMSVYCRTDMRHVENIQAKQISEEKIVARATDTWVPPVADSQSIKDVGKYRPQRRPRETTLNGVVDLSVKKKRSYAGNTRMGKRFLSKTLFQDRECVEGTIAENQSFQPNYRNMNRDGNVVSVSSKPDFMTDISRWTVDQVASFVSSIPMCQEYVEVFLLHQIDGTTLPFLKEHHLLNVFGMKLGPAINLQRALVPHMQGLLIDRQQCCNDRF